MQTITDLYNHYEMGCGTEKPMRTLEELRGLFHQSDSRYGSPRSIEAFWILVFGREGDGSDCWAWSDDYPSDEQWQAYRDALASEDDEGY